MPELTEIPRAEVGHGLRLEVPQDPHHRVGLRSARRQILHSDLSVLLFKVLTGTHATGAFEKIQFVDEDDGLTRPCNCSTLGTSCALTRRSLISASHRIGRNTSTASYRENSPVYGILNNSCQLKAVRFAQAGST